ncbi:MULTISPECIES: ferric reductase [unclassified Streptomyces]|uniref:ferric reductase n=1 Tax=unclassified Streptomyces TaxID=2593676 RepID=UPI002E194596|nr:MULTISPECIES: ferric reductase [unclassified Streptomyces]
MNFLRKLAFWSIAVIFPLPLVALFETESGDPDRLKNIIVLGLVAYCWWLLAVLLSARPGWLDRRVGLPAIYGLHGMLGVLALGLAYIHSQNSYAPSALARDLGEWALYGSFGLLCFSVFFLSGWLVDRSQLVGRVKALLEKVVRRQLSVWVHRLNLLVIAAIWLHVHLLGRASEHFAFMVLFDFYTVSVLGVYVWKKWISPDGYLTGTVRSNIARGETTRVVTVVLDRPDARIRPGDFFFLRFEGSKAIGKEWHPFSVTGDSQKELTFTIRQHGDYTRKISDVEVGTRVRLEGSFGRFESIVQGLDDDTPLVLLGMGAGIAPLLSLAAAHHKRRPIELLWSVRRPDDPYYGDVLDEFVRDSGGSMRVTTRVGRFRKEHLAAALSPHAVEKGAVFVVGPNPAVLASRSTLRRVGVARRRVHDERLTM